MKMRAHKKFSRLLRQKIRTSILSDHGTAILADTWNGQLLVEAGDFHVGRRLLRDGSYDREEIEWLRAGFGGTAGTVVVVGTHVGSLLVPLAKSAGRVVGFEADGKNFRLLQQNLLLNRIDNAQVHNVAVGAADGTAAFARNPLNTGNSSIVADGARGGVEVAMVTLDSALAALDEPIDLLVMDIEGHEYHALAGGRHTLDRTRRLYIEFAPEHLQAQGCAPAELLDLLCSRFEHLYTLDSGAVRHWAAREGAADLLERSHRRGFLTNLLFSSEPLPAAASAPAGASRA